MPDTNHFEPTHAPRKFRDALGRFATGVTVITAQTDDGPIGMTANSFASLSLDPALILWSPAKASTRHDHFLQAEAFNVHILSASPRALSDAFAQDMYGFAGLNATPNALGVPILEGCIAVFECRKYAAHHAGDHTIIIGEVMKFSAYEGRPLIFLDGNFET